MSMKIPSCLSTPLTNMNLQTIFLYNRVVLRVHHLQEGRWPDTSQCWSRKRYRFLKCSPCTLPPSVSHVMEPGHRRVQRNQTKKNSNQYHIPERGFTHRVHQPPNEVYDTCRLYAFFNNSPRDLAQADSSVCPTIAGVYCKTASCRFGGRSSEDQSSSENRTCDEAHMGFEDASSMTQST